MRKKDWLVILGIVILAGALYLAAPLWRPAASEDQVVVTVNQQTYAVIPLSEPKRLTITQADGSQNVLIVTPEGAYMESATCQGHDCILQGPVTLENYELRPNQNFIICLPNRVTVELQVSRRP